MIRPKAGAEKKVPQFLQCSAVHSCVAVRRSIAVAIGQHIDVVGKLESPTPSGFQTFENVLDYLILWSDHSSLEEAGYRSQRERW